MSPGQIALRIGVSDEELQQNVLGSEYGLGFRV